VLKLSRFDLCLYKLPSVPVLYPDQFKNSSKLRDVDWAGREGVERGIEFCLNISLFPILIADARDEPAFHIRGVVEFLLGIVSRAEEDGSIAVLRVALFGRFDEDDCLDRPCPRDGPGEALARVSVSGILRLLWGVVLGEDG
jgi:hypothetical protein